MVYTLHKCELLLLRVFVTWSKVFTEQLRRTEVERVHHSFSWLSNIPLCRYTAFCLLIHPLVDFWVVFQPLAVVNGAAENIVEQVFVWTCVVSALGPTSRTGVAGASGSYAELPEEP